MATLRCRVREGDSGDGSVHSRAGMYTPSLPLLSRNDNQWVDTIASLKETRDI